jgi:hypothetical protein
VDVWSRVGPVALQLPVRASVLPRGPVHGDVVLSASIDRRAWTTWSGLGLCVASVVGEIRL